MKKFIRAFFAIDLPPTVKKAVEELIVDCQKQDTHQVVRWSKPHDLHITLQFMEKIDLSDILALTTHVREEMKPLTGFSFTLDPLELFPSKEHPKVISLGVHVNDQLTELSHAVGRGIVATNYPIEDRSFRAHLTLGRFNRIDKSFSLPEKKFSPIEIFAKEIILFQSMPSARGSNYIILEKILIGL